MGGGRGALVGGWPQGVVRVIDPDNRLAVVDIPVGNGPLSAGAVVDLEHLPGVDLDRRTSGPVPAVERLQLRPSLDADPVALVQLVRGRFGGRAEQGDVVELRVGGDPFAVPAHPFVAGHPQVGPALPGIADAEIGVCDVLHKPGELQLPPRPNLTWLVTWSNAAAIIPLVRTRRAPRAPVRVNRASASTSSRVELTAARCARYSCSCNGWSPNAHTADTDFGTENVKSKPATAAGVFVSCRPR